MPMKAALLSLFCSALTVTGQNVIDLNLTNQSRDVNVPAGQRMTILNLAVTPTPSVANGQLLQTEAVISGFGDPLKLVVGDEVLVFRQGVCSSSIYGPATVRVDSAPFNIRDLAEPTAVRVLSKTTFVRYIVQDSRLGGPVNGAALLNRATAGPDGQVQVLLEESVDLQTWVPTSPGVVEASEQDRFFRARVQP